MTALSKELQIMGVMNITPDSFSDGGKFFSSSAPRLDQVIDSAASMITEGVDWLDVGGESTRPGATKVSFDEEMARVVPVIEALRSRFDTKISVDTSRPEVIEHAALAGANMVNDVRALQLEDAMQAAVKHNLSVCLMHMQGSPESMQQSPEYGSVTEEVESFLLQRAEAAQKAGIAKEKICLDPGFGFGKTLEHNLELVAAIPRLSAHEYPLLVGFSRKSMIGAITGRDVKDREAGTTVLNTMALERGASIFRVHNVSAASDMIKLVRAYNANNK